MPEAGELKGPYRLISTLGRGAMGEVWRARDERLDRYVALKVLPAEYSEDAERRTRILREARAAAAIRHPNVVTLFDVISTDEDILVMELVEGRTLSDVLRKDGPPPLASALDWIYGIADALVAAHARGILHRDIKAANIMITLEGVKVLDFGLAKMRGVESEAPSGASYANRATVPRQQVELDATMPSSPTPPARPDDRHTVTALGEPESYRTQAGQLLGTPLYMAPEQVQGGLPDERSEVFSVGVVAYEILEGKPPYTATTLETLFDQISKDSVPDLGRAPAAVAAIIRRALEKEPGKRWPSMRAFRDAIDHERRHRSTRRLRWPTVAALALAATALIGYALWPAPEGLPQRPGDEQVQRALTEYDLFYNDKALSSLRAALAADPTHPRAGSYLLLFGAVSEGDRSKALTALRGARPIARAKDRALVETALTLAERGPAAAREVLERLNLDRDRELAFWIAELDYRAGNYQLAGDRYRALLDSPDAALRGRIYDHYSSVLLYLDRPAEALAIGKLYRDAFPGEADAVGVYATTLAAAGKYEEAIAAAQEALQLSEGEDTLAGLAKVYALAGDRARSRDLYARSLERAGASRRPLRRAAFALLAWIDGDVEAARATVQPCLEGVDAAARERGACLFVAGVIDPDRATWIAERLDELAAAATAETPAYGAPAALAALVRARSEFFGGACVVKGETRAPSIDPTRFDVPLDFYTAYHVPFFSTWQACERAAALAAGGERARARTELDSVLARAPNRSWVIATRAHYE